MGQIENAQHNYNLKPYYIKNYIKVAALYIHNLKTKIINLYKKPDPSIFCLQ